MAFRPHRANDGARPSVENPLFIAQKERLSTRSVSEGLFRPEAVAGSLVHAAAVRFGRAARGDAERSTAGTATLQSDDG